MLQCEQTQIILDRILKVLLIPRYGFGIGITAMCLGEGLVLLIAVPASDY